MGVDGLTGGIFKTWRQNRHGLEASGVTGTFFILPQMHFVDFMFGNKPD